MKPLTVRFPDKQKLQINDLSEVIGVNTSSIARAALQIGLEQIREAASNCPGKASNVCMIKALEAMQ